MGEDMRELGPSETMQGLAVRFIPKGVSEQFCRAECTMCFPFKWISWYLYPRKTRKLFAKVSSTRTSRNLSRLTVVDLRPQ